MWPIDSSLSIPDSLPLPLLQAWYFALEMAYFLINQPLLPACCCLQRDSERGCRSAWDEPWSSPSPCVPTGHPRLSVHSERPHGEALEDALKTKAGVHLLGLLKFLVNILRRHSRKVCSVTGQELSHHVSVNKSHLNFVMFYLQQKRLHPKTKYLGVIWFVSTSQTVAARRHVCALTRQSKATLSHSSHTTKMLILF